MSELDGLLVTVARRLADEKVDPCRYCSRQRGQRDELLNDLVDVAERALSYARDLEAQVAMLERTISRALAA